MHRAQGSQRLSVDLQKAGGEKRTEHGARISPAYDSLQCLVDFGAFPERLSALQLGAAPKSQKQVKIQITK